MIDHRAVHSITITKVANKWRIAITAVRCYPNGKPHCDQGGAQYGEVETYEELTSIGLTGLLSFIVSYFTSIGDRTWARECQPTTITTIREA